MKFKLVENINSGFENEPAMGVSDGNILNEKMWVEVTPMENDKPLDEPFYFYSTNKNPQSDINTLLPIINNSQTGTYKQQLNPDIVKKLKSMYNKCVENNTEFKLKLGNTNIDLKNINKENILTLTDRDLRTKAHASIEGIDSKNYLIHHKLKGEYNNDPENIMLISKEKGLHFAHAIHKILEYYGENYPTDNVTIPIVEYKDNEWVTTHSVDIIFK